MCAAFDPGWTDDTFRDPADLLRDLQISAADVDYLRGIITDATTQPIKQSAETLDGLTGAIARGVAATLSEGADTLDGLQQQLRGRLGFELEGPGQTAAALVQQVPLSSIPPATPPQECPPGWEWVWDSQPTNGVWLGSCQPVTTECEGVDVFGSPVCLPQPPAPTPQPPPLPPEQPIPPGEPIPPESPPETPLPPPPQPPAPTPECPPGMVWDDGACVIPLPEECPPPLVQDEQGECRLPDGRPPGPPAPPKPPEPPPEPGPDGQCPPGWTGIVDDDGVLLGCRRPEEPPPPPEQPCIPICGISPGTPVAPPGAPPAPDPCPPGWHFERPPPGSRSPERCVRDTPEPTPPERPGPGGTGPSGLNTEFCGLDAYLKANQPDLPGGIERDRPLESWLYGSREELEKREAKWREDVKSRIPTVDAISALWQLTILRNVRWLDTWLAGAAQTSGCGDVEQVGLVLVGAFLNLGSYLFGDSIEQLSTPIKYMRRTNCPVDFPSAGEAFEAFLGNQIDEELLQNWLALNGKCWEPFEKVLQARRGRLDPLQLAVALRREIIDEQQYADEIRRSGFFDGAEPDWLKKLTEYVAPITDLIRFMVRDVEDRNVYERFGMDQGFADKWQGLTQEQGRKQGITDETALRYWRAHWSIPSPGQLFEMWHRSRALPEGDERRVEWEDVDEALKQQDILPFWISRYQLINFRPLTRVDARRALEQGVIDRERVYRNYIALGYSEDDADTLTRFAESNRTRTMSNLPIVKSYVDGQVSADEVTAQLTRLGAPEVAIQDVLTQARREMSEPFARRCRDALRQRFFDGELDLAQVGSQMLSLGYNSDYVSFFLRSIQCEREARGKDASTQQLCEWFELGLIDRDEFLRRAERLGWSSEDASKIFVQCSAKLDAKRVREAEKTAQEAERLRKERQRQEERERAKRERRAAQNARDLEKLRRAEARREALLQKSIALFDQSSGLGIDAAGACIQDLVAELRRDFLLTADARVQSIVLAVERYKPASCPELIEKTRELAEELEELGQPVES